MSNSLKDGDRIVRVYPCSNSGKPIASGLENINSLLDNIEAVISMLEISYFLFDTIFFGHDIHYIIKTEFELIRLDMEEDTNLRITKRTPII